MKVQDVSGIYENVENRKMRMPKDMSWAFFLLVSVLLFLWPGLPVAEGTRTVCRAAQVITTDSLQARILDGSLAGQLVDLAEDPFWNETRLQEGEKVLLRLHTSESGLIEDVRWCRRFWGRPCFCGCAEERAGECCIPLCLDFCAPGEFYFPCGWTALEKPDSRRPWGHR